MNERKNNQKKNSKPGVIIAGILLLLGLFENGGEVAGISLGIIILIVAIVFVISLVKKKVSTANADGTVKSGPIYTPASAPAQRTVSARPAQQSVSAQKAAVPAQLSRGNRYVEQLNVFLKNGIIEREEYNVLMRRWGGRK